MNFEILSDPSNLKLVRQKIKEFITEYEFTKVDEFNVVLVIDESVQNVIRYAYEMDKTKKIIFNINKNHEDLIVKIRDFGKQVDISKIKPRDLDDVRPGGLGVHFIKSICKDVHYEHQSDGGTELTLTF